jgi:glycine cleavage system regulatory protein
LSRYGAPRRRDKRTFAGYKAIIRREAAPVTKALVLTFVGEDRPGHVNAIASRIAAEGGAWLESRLARLAGEFAGIVRVEAPDERVEALTASLHALATSGLAVTVAEAHADEREKPEIVTLELLCLDRPGIVREVTDTLTALDINIEEFESGLVPAAFTGQPMFHATARLASPPTLRLEDLRQRLEKLAGEMMADISLAEMPEKSHAV